DEHRLAPDQDRAAEQVRIARRGLDELVDAGGPIDPAAVLDRRVSLVDERANAACRGDDPPQAGLVEPRFRVIHFLHLHTALAQGTPRVTTGGSGALPVEGALRHAANGTTKQKMGGILWVWSPPLGRSVIRRRARISKRCLPK